MLKDLKHPMTPGYITDDVSQLICKMYHPPIVHNNLHYTTIKVHNGVISLSGLV